MNVYMIGIKGVGMTALAVYLRQKGHRVWGSDVAEVFPTDPVLAQHKIRVIEGFKRDNITGDIDLVITTGAHGGLNNPEAQEAARRDVPVKTLARAVGDETKHFKTVISVSGTHGKTTTSAMLAFVLHTLDLKTSHLAGATRFSGLFGGHWGGEDYFVVEADEYVTSPGVDDTPRFMYQDPNYIICTNIEYDHPDVFKTVADVEDAFFHFFQKLTKKKGTLIFYKKDKRLQKIAAGLSGVRTRSYDIDEGDDLSLAVFGKHNRLNAQAVLACVEAMGLDVDTAKKILADYRGSARRLERVFEGDRIVLYDDYAHHPTELEAVISALRSQYPNRRLVLVFQPHTYSRTKAFLDEFIGALSKADYSFVLDIFSSAREKKDLSISSKKLVEKARKLGKNNISYIPDDQIYPILSEFVMRGDVIATAGAGDVYKLHDRLIQIIKSQKKDGPYQGPSL